MIAALETQNTVIIPHPPSLSHMPCPLTEREGKKESTWPYYHPHPPMEEGGRRLHCFYMGYTRIVEDRDLWLLGERVHQLVVVAAAAHLSEATHMCGYLAPDHFIQGRAPGQWPPSQSQ